MSKVLFVFFLMSFSGFCLSSIDENDSTLVDKIIMSTYEYAKYGYDDSILSIERLNRVEHDIEKLKGLTTKYPNEARIYYVIHDLYSSRGRLLGMKIHIENRKEWFSLPVVQENVQGIRDNCYEAIRVHELGKGTPLEQQMILNCAVSSLFSRQFLERAHKAIHKMLPDVIECDHDADPTGDCITQYKKDIVLKDYLDVQNEYIVYGYFDDAERLNNEIAQISEEGKTTAAEMAARIKDARQNFNPDKYKGDIDYELMQPGGTPKPITIKAVDAITEFQKAVQEKERIAKEAEVSSSTSPQQSSAASLEAVELVERAPENNWNQWIMGIVIGGVLLLIAIFALRRRH